MSSRYKNIIDPEKLKECEQQKISRAQALERSSKLLGIESVSLLNFPDNELDSTSALTLAKEIEAAIDKSRPNLIFSHSANDLNQDHKAVSRATDIATRPIMNAKLPLSDKLLAVLKFRVISAYEHNFYNQFQPNLF